jgi:putative ATPase
VIFGPAGCGKTSFFRLLARARSEQYFFKSCSAVTTGAPEVMLFLIFSLHFVLLVLTGVICCLQLRKLLEEADRNRSVFKKQTALFVDEIHRLTKPQQDVLLPFVEDGACILLGATTENPSFCLQTAILSRCKVMQFSALGDDSVLGLLERAQAREENLRNVSHEVLRSIALAADGDARTALNQLEIAASLIANDPAFDASQHVAKRSHCEKKCVVVWVLKSGLKVRYDKNGEQHYDLISALHKSMRGGWLLLFFFKKKKECLLMCGKGMQMQVCTGQLEWSKEAKSQNTLQGQQKKTFYVLGFCL